MASERLEDGGHGLTQAWQVGITYVAVASDAKLQWVRRGCRAGVAFW